MAFTVYTNVATVDGSPLFAYGIATPTTAGAGPAAGVYVYALGDSEQKLRTFYSSTVNGIALPTLVAPPFATAGFNGCGTTNNNGAVFQLVQGGSDYGAAATQGGSYVVTLSYSTGSPDSASPCQYTLDQGAIILVSSTAYNGA